VSSFQKNFLAAPSAEGPRAWLAAFGKHPGWDDHIEDLGLETETLALAKQRIYVEGISSQIDSGAWEKLDPANRLEGFDHVFLWERGANCLFGCIVSSVDGKGRSRYPMILCAEFAEVPRARILGELRPIIEQAMKDGRAAPNAAGVKQVVADAREKLRAAIKAPPATSADATAPATTEANAPLTQLAASPALGVHGPLASTAPAAAAPPEGLLRILYQIKHHLAPWARGHDEEPPTQSVSLRVPRVRDEPGAGLALWSSCLASQLAAGAPRLLLWPRHGTWLDAIVGEPAPADFFGLRGNLRALPCASDVPYEMDEAFRAEAAALIEAAAAKKDAGRTIFGAASTEPSTRKFAQRAASASQAAGERLQQSLQELRSSSAGAKRKWLLWGAAILGALVVIVGAVLLLKRSASAPAKNTAAQQTGTPATAGTPAGVVADADLAASWKKLCTAYYDWVGSLQAALNDGARRQRWSTDADLRETAVAHLGNGAPKRLELDPRVLAGSNAPLTEIGNTVPASIATTDGAGKVRAAAARVEAIEKLLGQWPALATAREQKNKLAATWPKAVASVALPETLPLDQSLATAIDQALTAAQQLARIFEQSDATLVDLKRLEDAGDPALAAAATSLQAAAAGATSLEALAAALTPLRAELAPVLARLGADWSAGRIDRERFFRDRGANWSAGVAPAAVLKKWSAEVADYTRVADLAPQLPTADWQKALGESQRLQSQLAAIPEARAAAAALATRQQALQAEWSALLAPGLVQKDVAPRLEAARAALAKQAALAAELSATLARHTDTAGWMRQLRDTRIAESPVIDTEWQRQRDLLLKPLDAEALKADPSRFIAERVRAERIQRFLRELAATKALPENFPAEEDTDEAIARELKARLHTAREAALAKAIDALTWKPDGSPGETEEEFWRKPAVRPIAVSYEKDYKDLRGFGRELTKALEPLAEGVAWQNAGVLLDGWRPDWTKPEKFAGSAALTAALQRVARLDALVAAKERGPLLVAARGESLAEAVTAWQRLGELPDWLRDAADLEADQQLATTLLAKAQREIKRPAALETFRTKLGEGQSQRWSAALARARSEADLARLFGAMPAYGIDETNLPAPARFNALLHRLRTKAWSKIPKEQGPQERDEAIALLNAQSAADPARVLALVGQLQKVEFAERGIDPARTGPGASEWKLDEASSADRLVYVWAGKDPKQPHRLEFARVAVEGGAPVYLGVSEMPVQLFLDWLGATAGLPEKIVAAEKPMFEDFESLGPGGPRALGFRPEGKTWKLLPRFASTWGVPMPEAERVPPPTALSPVNYISFSAAELFAASLHCRLPTEAQWRSAARLEQAAPGAAPNLRDPRWRKLASVTPTQRWLPSAGGNVFRETSIVAPGTEVKTRDADDPALLFNDVTGEPGRPLHHLVGNVAEFVLDAQNRAGVIGGSALSPADLPVDRFVPLDRSERETGYCDVGFRLAFDAGPLSGVAQIQAIFAATPFLAAEK
jgi:hypothetical protein